ncbi:MAG: sugar ABC transporter ATP-binding protein [Spirochaetaceae bacterium]|nr:sugar ABC transporter ATP-binding protein [Spirochaetaceae bacterium]
MGASVKAGSAPPLLELRSLTKFFSDDFSLHDISLELRAGEVHVLVGQNGSGKSALMKAICGIFRRDSGSVLLEGSPAEFATVNEARGAGIVMQYQNAQLFDNLSVAENVFFRRIPRRGFFTRTLDHYRLHEECSALFARLGIGISPEALVSRLGYTQRLVVSAAQTCVAPAKIVIFDEPTAGMTDPEREILFAIVREIRDRGCGVFYISHKLDEIPKIGDRVTVLHGGKIAASLPDGSASREELIRFMTGGTCSERYPRLRVEYGPQVLIVEHLKSGAVLEDVSFSLRKGEILGITGLMGSGRTRLANCLFGQSRPTGGVVRVEGRRADFGHPSEALKRGIALIPEDRDNNASFHDQDIVRNISVAALERFVGAYGLDTRYMEELTDEYINSLGILPGHPSDIMRSYSGGNQQKVVVARWFMSLCRIYIMDEPTRGVDAASRIDIYNAMNDLVTKGASIILISSDVEEILGMCDRVLVLAKGRIACDLPRAQATSEKIIDFASI